MTSDTLLRFIFSDKQVRGQWLHLSDSLQQMLQNHDYPLAVKQLLAELVVATSLLTATLKFEGEIAVQLQGDGPVRFAAVNGNHKQQFRGVVRLQSELQGDSFRQLIGEGYLLVTISPEQGERYQGIIPLAGDSLTETLEAYFTQSEQLPTRLYLHTDVQDNTIAGGMLLQVLPVDPAKAKLDFDDLVVLTNTLTKDELLQLPAEQLLYRLYHEQQVEVFPTQPVSFFCGCSWQKCENAIVSLGKEVISEHIDSGQLDITCEYCNKVYQFNADDLTQIVARL
ncbi:Hsp33 family molecular chaperone HslO [Arsukibacterium sp.]|uniref:Hsp33 family molecular chaperone HslO n=1 Tax=Arsukibacterium sp. TaxID=1977258 RepID=UPI002FDB44DF